MEPSGEGRRPLPNPHKKRFLLYEQGPGEPCGSTRLGDAQRWVRWAGAGLGIQSPCPPTCSDAMPTITPPKAKRSRYFVQRRDAGNPKTFRSFLPFPKSLSGPSCQEDPVYDAPGNNNNRMNAMGRVVGGSYLKPCVYDHFLKLVSCDDLLV